MLKHDRGFRTKNFIVGFLYFCMLCCFLPRLLCFCSIQSACMLLQTDSNTFWAQVIDYSLPGSTCHIRFRIDISHLSIFGIVVHGKSYISHRFYFYGILYLYLLFDFCVRMWPKKFCNCLYNHLFSLSLFCWCFRNRLAIFFANVLLFINQEVCDLDWVFATIFFLVNIAINSCRTH